MRFIDTFLNKITMYKLVLYGLFLLVVVSILFGFTGVLAYNGLQLIYSFLLLIIVCHFANAALANLFRVQANIESSYITAIILFFILMPLSSFVGVTTFVTVAMIAMLSKYFLAIQKEHIFNPVAVALVIAGVFGSGEAFWWIGSSVMLLPVIVLGFLVLRKLQRFQMFLTFAGFAMLSISFVALIKGFAVEDALVQALLSGPLVFFGTIMFTEPYTTPPKKKFQIMYGVIVGILYGAQFHIGNLYATPELALILGNIFSFIVSSRDHLILTLVEKKPLGGDMYDFVWQPDKKLFFEPGQYLEWTLGHQKPDVRGNRRYFTIASSPTEKHLHLGVKFYPNPSSFKTKLLSLTPGESIVASQLSGEFTLPSNQQQKLVFIAGGIGITPFRSMVKFLLDAGGQKRDIILLYSNRTAGDIAYKDLFDFGESVGVKTLYVVGDLGGADLAGNMRLGMVTGDLITSEIPDYKNRMFYISGPHGMVSSFEGTLSKLGVKSSNIKVDFFPGFV